MRGGRGSLAGRIALLAVAVVALTALLTGGIAINLIRDANARSAQQSLAAIADDAAAGLDRKSVV